MKHSIHLIGFMGSGKSTVGRLLARSLGWPFADLDELIESQSGQTVSEIFGQFGEAHFRALESQELQELARRQGMVAALGGGATCSPQNREISGAVATTVWLRVSLETAWQRCRESPHRPLALDRQGFERLFESRNNAYRWADVHVECSEASPQEIVDEIKKKLEGKSIWPGSK